MDNWADRNVSRRVGEDCCCKDYGTYTEDSCNYATYGHALAEGIEKGEVECGIAMCGSGEGISMTLNKHQQISAGLVWQPEIDHQ